MNVKLIRKEFTEVSTIGNLLIDDQFFCFTLEDVVRDVKIPGQTAIPCGSYEVITNYSARFKKVMPLLLNVPGFEGVRIHSGNSDKDTEGCILLGYTKEKDFIGQSRPATFDFMTKLKSGLKDGKVRIEITNEMVS